MEKYNLPNDFKVFCVTAKSFPDGIKEAWEKLHKMLPTTEGRTFYGISYGDGKGGIIYQAAVTESFEGEAEKYGCESFTIKKGEYLTEPITDYMKNIETIGTTFQRLLADPRLDSNSYCLEWYKNDREMFCMVKINS